MTFRADRFHWGDDGEFDWHPPDKVKAFDESLHPRDEQGRFSESGGGSAGESDDGGARGGTDDFFEPVQAFISPNVSNLSFVQAEQELHSQRQGMLLKAGTDVDHSLGIGSAKNSNVIGAWSDGAENSMMVSMPGASLSQARVASAMKGYLADQKAVLVFAPDPKGDSFMADFEANGTMGKIHERLLQDGVAFHTLEPRPNGATVRVFGQDQATLDAVSKAAKRYGSQVQITAGNGEFVGTQKSDGTDREQRDDARAIYRRIIAAADTAGELPGRDVGKIWNDVRGRWTALSGEEVAKAFDESLHPRDEAGKFTESGGGEAGGGEDEAEAKPAAVKLDPKVTSVGGDKWNKDTARRLESEYQTSKPNLSALNDNAVKDSPTVRAISLGMAPSPPKDKTPSSSDWTNLNDEQVDAVTGAWLADHQDEFDSYKEAMEHFNDLTDKEKAEIAAEYPNAVAEHAEMPFIPESWQEMTTDQQSTVEDNWKENTFIEFLNSEQESFYENDGADYAKQQVVESFNQGGDMDWAEEAINDVKEEFEADETPIPYETIDLIAAIDLEEWQMGGSYNQKLGVTFNDDKLQFPTDAPTPPDPNQPELPNIPPPEPLDLSTHLTPDMRDRITKALHDAFEKEADHKQVDPPEYLEESAKDFQQQMWDDKDEAEKFEWAKTHTDVLDEPTEGVPAGGDKPASKAELPTIDALPNKYDPLNETSGADYQRTQRLARYMSVTRTMEIMKERGIKGETNGKPFEYDIRDIAVMDNGLWEAWKGSSTATGGKLLQVATADELGGRLNTKTAHEIDREHVIHKANVDYDYIGGYEGIKAYVRAKWETTQFLLEKADMAELQLYRGYTEDEPGKYTKDIGVIARHLQAGEHPIEGFTLMPTLDVRRNGAVSTTTDRTVANNWKKGSARKVTLRTLVPRTAAISIPAYGINVHSEHEVVIAGTAFKGWDVWDKFAPSFEQYPMKIAA